MQDDVAAGLLAGEIALGAHAQALFQADVSNPWIRRQQAIHWIRSIVDDQQLARRVVLAQEVFDGAADECRPVSCGHDARNQR